ncbi:hypothetical protein K469DRAFT_713665 [Zopfia rhizophila CBS 207.26]|uniref:F-box domain-containing protein n=1 Tax=Zopfia rhizophila CBS 207.26 TaxID=1314779 RepID=A0A6A6DPT8_9PEZI|nr:hypothetical protein K469DRAFT_713665 [Zopfia rhizophila CBS 207.26]
MPNSKSKPEYDPYDPQGLTQPDSAGFAHEMQVLRGRLQRWMRTRFKGGKKEDGDEEAAETPAEWGRLASRRQDESKPSFLDLPGELRNDIYYLIFNPHQFCYLAAYITGPRDIFRGLLQPSILRVSRQIRAESLSFLCSTKHFKAMNAPSASTFLRYIGPIGRANLTCISLVLSHKFRHTFTDDLPLWTSIIKFLSETTSLQIFHFDIDDYLHALVPGEDGEVADSVKWEIFTDLRKAVERIDGAKLTWKITLEGMLNNENYRMGMMTCKLQQVFGAENRRGGRVWRLNGSEIPRERN